MCVKNVFSEGSIIPSVLIIRGTTKFNGICVPIFLKLYIFFSRPFPRCSFLQFLSDPFVTNNSIVEYIRLIFAENRVYAIIKFMFPVLPRIPVLMPLKVIFNERRLGARRSYLVDNIVGNVNVIIHSLYKIDLPIVRAYTTRVCPLSRT